MLQNELPKGFATLAYGAKIEASFEKYLKEMSGYKRFTTFASDLAIAECYGADALKDTYNRVVNEWLGDVKYFTEFVMALNIACWRWYEWEGGGSELGQLYSDLYYKARNLALETYKGVELMYYLDTTD